MAFGYNWLSKAAIMYFFFGWGFFLLHILLSYTILYLGF